LKIALRNSMKHNLMNVSFYLADATELPFADNYFDYVSVCLGLHDKISAVRCKVVSEMIRVVRPDGGLIFIDYPVPPVTRISGFLSRTVEFMAGGNHYKGFKDYVISGGLERILKVFNLHEEKRDYLKGGLLSIVKISIT
jgi:ubiquinone/menaquinone biosynthesis C-methylase UbiE